MDSALQTVTLTKISQWTSISSQKVGWKMWIITVFWQWWALQLEVVSENISLEAGHPSSTTSLFGSWACQKPTATILGPRSSFNKMLNPTSWELPPSGLAPVKNHLLAACKIIVCPDIFQWNHFWTKSTEHSNIDVKPELVWLSYNITGHCSTRRSPAQRMGWCPLRLGCRNAPATVGRASGLEPFEIQIDMLKVDAQVLWHGLYWFMLCFFFGVLLITASALLHCFTSVVGPTSEAEPRHRALWALLVESCGSSSGSLDQWGHSTTPHVATHVVLRTQPRFLAPQPQLVKNWHVETCENSVNLWSLGLKI